MVKCCVFFAVRTEFLNIIQAIFGFKGLIRYYVATYIGLLVAIIKFESSFVLRKVIFLHDESDGRELSWSPLF
jgi:uncharacterized membrane protein